VLFARAIPTLVAERFGAALDAFLGRSALTRADLAGHACHPGGAKVLAALEDSFGLTEGGLTEARAVLRDHGNMSAPTVLFVLDRVRRTAEAGPVIATAMGPGFTAGFALLQPAPAAGAA
jgi:alkylresorcinol/alkylpyrone synthase